MVVLKHNLSPNKAETGLISGEHIPIHSPYGLTEEIPLKSGVIDYKLLPRHY
jgi:hypothetical protein